MTRTRPRGSTTTATGALRRRRCRHVVVLFSNDTMKKIFLLTLFLVAFAPFRWQQPFLPVAFAQQQQLDGPGHYQKGQELFKQAQYEQAALELWKAVLLHSSTPVADQYNVQDVFQLFLQCYVALGNVADGFAFVASESFKRGQNEMGKNYLDQALQVDATNAAALHVKREFASFLEDDKGQQHTVDGSSESSNNQDLLGKTPEDLYAIASQHFSDKAFEECADVFEISCLRSAHKLGPSCANAVYCRNMIVDYGFNGSQFEQDMERISSLTRQETSMYRLTAVNQDPFAWRRATSVHPHMMLGYPVEPMLKRYVAESVAYMDEKMARAGHLVDGQLPELPNDMPYDRTAHRERFQKEFRENNNNATRIRVGFVGSGFNSKAVLFLSQDMFRFFDPSLEVHVFSFGPPDHAMFIQHGMRGVDWRERVRANVAYFHDCQAMKLDHVKAARFIHDQGIHILIEWDGYARQGERAQGLFALRPAPVQILHQEYLGTSGALYVDYLFSDVIASPPETQELYTEKLIYMPNHFFSKGHAYQAEVKQPTYEYTPKETPYRVGTGSPRENRCLAPHHVGPERPSFVFCNFNKLLKANPETIRSWIRILRQVPDSILCLLENPNAAIPYVRRFVHEAAGTSDNGSDPDSFVPGDGDALNDRIHFLPWEKNPFDHQMRNQDFCNVMLDSHPYNGHTVAQDALYGGVPIVTRSDGDDMSSRVTTSANKVLGLEELNAYGGPRDYEDIAIQLGTNATMYKEIRSKLIGTALQRNPMHPYWDVGRYVKNFEVGLRTAWELFMDGKPPQHIYIEEPVEAQKGTYDDEIRANPPEGKSKGGNSHSDEL